MNKTILKDNVIINHHGEKGYIGKLISKTESYFEKESLDAIFEGLKKIKFEYIVEIGANIGNHILYYNKYANYNKMIAFEPLEANLEVLRKNIQENKIKNIIIKPYGLGTENAVVDFFVNTRNYGASSINKYHRLKKLAIKTSIEVKSFKKELDFLPKNMNIFIKIDIEGAEKNILNDLMDLLSTRKSILMIELRTSDYKGKSNILLLKKFISFVSKKMNLIHWDNGVNLVLANKNIDGEYDFIPQKQANEIINKIFKIK